MSQSVIHVDRLFTSLEYANTVISEWKDFVSIWYIDIYSKFVGVKWVPIDTPMLYKTYIEPYEQTWKKTYDPTEFMFHTSWPPVLVYVRKDLIIECIYGLEDDTGCRASCIRYIIT